MCDAGRACTYTVCLVFNAYQLKHVPYARRIKANKEVNTNNSGSKVTPASNLVNACQATDDIRAGRPHSWQVLVCVRLSSQTTLRLTRGSGWIIVYISQSQTRSISAVPLENDPAKKGQLQCSLDGAETNDHCLAPAGYPRRKERCVRQTAAGLGSVIRHRSPRGATVEPRSARRRGPIIISSWSLNIQLNSLQSPGAWEPRASAAFCFPSDVFAKPVNYSAVESPRCRTVRGWTAIATNSYEIRVSSTFTLLTQTQWGILNPHLTLD